jgi:hypothetical protein
MSEWRRLETREAADYCRVSVSYFKYQLEQGRGPAHVRPSPKRRYFETEDLDAWMQTWARGEGCGK